LINDKIKALPHLPGVYQYFDKNGKIIYVGKAKNLKKRVSSYFTKSNLDRKTKVMVKQINDIKYIVVNSELEALLLENSLIKEHQPRYNVLLKDDKTYPWICIKKEPFPRVFYTRRIVKDGSLYFGPYPSVKMMQTILEIIRELYPLRTCNLNLSATNIQQKKYKVCLEYHIGNCKAPCVGLQNEEEYNEYIENIKHLLKGHVYVLKQELKKKMLEFAESLAFEKAQELKEKIDILNRYESKFTVVSRTINNLDVASIIRKDNVAYVNVLRVTIVMRNCLHLSPLNQNIEINLRQK